MTRIDGPRLRALEGQRVSVALRDGSRIDDAELVSASSKSATLWLFVNGEDVFVRRAEVVDLWETLRRSRMAA